MNGDWLDPTFMRLITQALNETGVEGRFYQLEETNGPGGLLFLTPVQYGSLQAAYPHLLLFPQ